MKNKKQKKARWPDYEVVDLDKLSGTKIVTFGTTVFMRKDKKALRILFPCYQAITFCPEDEIKILKDGN